MGFLSRKKPKPAPVDIQDERPIEDDLQQMEELVPERFADEGPMPAGPVAHEDSSSSQAAGEEPSSTPPAEDAPEADGGEAPAAEEGSSGDAPAAEAEEDAPAAEAEAPAESNPEDELPWKERRRLQKSRRSRKAGPQLSVEDRVARRAEERRVRANLRRKQREAANSERQPGAGTPPAERESNAAKVRQGIVVSSKGDKSITVRIDIARRHRTYEKIVRSSTKLHAHDERNEAGEGDVVRVIETRPLSKTKRWRLVDVVEKAR
jgi:small subunit ribosomal protein S17